MKFKLNDYFTAYYSADMADESGVTIMVNLNECEDFDNEECFEGGNCILAEEICNKFNALKTADIDEFYNVREDVWNRYGFKLNMV